MADYSVLCFNNNIVDVIGESEVVILQSIDVSTELTLDFSNWSQAFLVLLGMNSFTSLRTL